MRWKMFTQAWNIKTTVRILFGCQTQKIVAQMPLNEVQRENILFRLRLHTEESVLCFHVKNSVK